MSTVYRVAAACFLSFVAPIAAQTTCNNLFHDGFEADAAAFKVEEAVARSNSEVLVCFNHEVDSTSLSSQGDQFTFDNSLSALSATIDSVDARNVLVTTGMQTTNASYSVVVASSVMDTLEYAVDAVSNIATFVGVAP